MCCQAHRANEHTHIIGATGLQVDSTTKEILQNGEKTFSFERTLQTGQELEVQFDIAPVTGPNFLLGGSSDGGEKFG